MSLSTDTKLALVLDRGGLANSPDIVKAWHHIGGQLSVYAASLEDESSGRNVFGGDPGGDALPRDWFETEVTHEKYLVYSFNVDHRGLTPNGVGPCQLTDRALQKAADDRGGCWLPLHNMTEGFSFLGGLINSAGSLELGFQHYNGSGPAAVAYGERLVAMQQDWHQRFVRAGLA